jgi:hypothetical protein
LVIRPVQRNSLIIALGFLGKPSIETASCSIGLHFFTSL